MTAIPKYRLAPSAIFFICAFSAAVFADAGWLIRTVDFGGSVGEYASLALDSRDEPYIAYYNWSNSSLRCALVSSDGKLTFHNVDVTGNSGKAASAAVGTCPSGSVVHISYIDTRSKSLKYARLEEGKWKIETVDSPADCERTSIALDRRGRPRISYSGGKTRALKMASPSETGDGWAIEPIDRDRCGHYSSIAIDSDDRAHIAYWDGVSSVLKYARKNPDGWRITIVDKDGDVGQCCSMKLDRLDRPHIAYYDYTLKNLKYARFDGSRGWHTRVVDADGDVGGYCSLALDGDSPRISYWDYTKLSLKYARLDGNIWTKTVVDAGGDVGGWTSLALDSLGSPHIAYYDYKNKNLKCALWREPSASRASREKNPPVLRVSSITFADEDGDGILSAGENGIFTFVIENSGAGLARGVFPHLALAEPADAAREFVFSFSEKISIRPQGRAEMRASVSAGPKVKDGRAIFEAKAMEDAGFDSSASRLVVLTEAHKPPALGVSSVGFKEIAFVEKNGEIDPGEAVEVTLELLNKGPGRAMNVRGVLSASDPDIFITSEREIFIGNLAPGEKRRISYTFTLSKRYKGASALPVSFSVEEKRREYSFSRSLGLAVGRKSSEMSEIFFAGRADAQAAGLSARDEVYERVPAARRANPDAVAVVAAVKTYRHPDVPCVEYALNDAALIKEYLVKAMGYREGNVIVLENPTKGDFERVFGTRDNPFGQLHTFVKPEKSDVFVYYSGHGAPDTETREAYIVPSDCHPNYVRLGGYSFDMLCDNLSRLPAASVTLVTDACFSGGFHSGNLITKGSPISLVPRRSHDGGGRLWILASSAEDEIASWYPEKKHGLFTYYFAMALCGRADRNSDGNLTFGEIKDYLDENVSYLARKLFNRAQTPVLYGDKSRVFIKYK